MRIDLAAQLVGQHLRAQTQAQKRLAGLQHLADPRGFLAQPVMIVIGPHRPAENHGTGMFVERVGQGLSQRRAADIQRVAALDQQTPDATGGRMGLMQNNDNRTVVRQGSHRPNRDPTGQGIIAKLA